MSWKGNAAWCVTFRTRARAGRIWGEVAFPLCRVRTLPQASHRGGVEHRLNAAPHSACCFWLLCPDRVENLDDEPGVDRGDRQFPQNRVDIGGEGVAPLLPVLCVTPARLISADEHLGHLAEGATPGDGKPPRPPLGFLRFERVYSIVA